MCPGSMLHGQYLCIDDTGITLTSENTSSGPAQSQCSCCCRLCRMLLPSVAIAVLRCYMIPSYQIRSERITVCDGRASHLQQQTQNRANISFSPQPFWDAVVVMIALRKRDYSDKLIHPSVGSRLPLCDYVSSVVSQCV